MQLAKSLPFLLLVGAVGMFWVSIDAFGQDRGDVMGDGHASCASLISDYQHNRAARQIQMAWIQGWISSAYRDGRMSWKVDGATLERWILGHCATSPQSTIASAANSFFMRELTDYVTEPLRQSVTPQQK